MKKLTTALLAAGLMSATFAAQAQEGPITGNVTLTMSSVQETMWAAGTPLA